MSLRLAVMSLQLAVMSLRLAAAREVFALDQLVLVLLFGWVLLFGRVGRLGQVAGRLEAL